MYKVSSLFLCPTVYLQLAAKDAFCSQLLSKRLFGDLHYVLRDYQDFSTRFIFRRKSQLHHFSKFFSPMQLVTDRENPPKNYFTFVEYVKCEQNTDKRFNNSSV